ncbi:MAG TPA: LytTR family DNA-binding domain-containing protein [Chitinophagaceae bacterium]|nr:LytTR family DNA-binding domain-containing protein [Chitinophagaceae bacterium]
MYNSLIVDDNKVARVLLRELLEQFPLITIAGECSNAAEAISFISNNKVDILFLDIEMPGMSGLELLRSLDKRPVTILTSGNKGYALEAFDLNVVDYLVKPVSLSRLMMSVNRAVELLKQKDVELNTIEQDHVFIKENKLIRKLDLNDIYILESKGDYVKIQLADKYHIIHSTLKAMEDRLPASKFLRVHRSYIVAKDKIDYLEDNVLYLNNVPVPVSESYRAELFKQLNIL